MYAKSTCVHDRLCSGKCRRCAVCKGTMPNWSKSVPPSTGTMHNSCQCRFDPELVCFKCKANHSQFVWSWAKSVTIGVAFNSFQCWIHFSKCVENGGDSGHLGSRHIQDTTSRRPRKTRFEPRNKDSKDSRTKSHPYLMCLCVCVCCCDPRQSMSQHVSTLHGRVPPNDQNFCCPWLTLHWSAPCSGSHDTKRVPCRTDSKNMNREPGHRVKLCSYNLCILQNGMYLFIDYTIFVTFLFFVSRGTAYFGYVWEISLPWKYTNVAAALMT